MTPDELLALYDREVRTSFPHRLPTGWTARQDGPLTRCRTPQGGFCMFTSDAGDLSHDQLTALVDRTFTDYTIDGVGRVEWKTFDHDRADLIPLLEGLAAVPEPHEALVLGEAQRLAGDPSVPDGLAIRRVSERADLDRIAAMESDVWGEDWSWLADDLEGRLTGSDPVEVYVVEDVATDNRVVCAAWLTPLAGTPVAGLWGGSTLAAYRGQGLYRALVAIRARRALELGYAILQVDASDDSRPILQRLGLHVVGGTTPYVFHAALTTQA